MRNGLEGFPIGSPVDELDSSASIALLPFFQIRNGREKFLIGELDSIAPPPVVADT